MRCSSNNGSVNRDEVWRRVAPLYEAVVRQVMMRLELEDDDPARDALHAVVARIAAGTPPTLRDWKTYLTKCAVNQHRHGHRNGHLTFFSELAPRERQRIFEEIPGSDRNPSEIAALQELKSMAMAELAKLPAQQQVVLRLWMTDRTTSEIADALGKRPATVRSLLRHGLAALRRKFRVA